MIILPVPPSRPCIRMRARFALVPGLSDSYLSRIALTAGVMLIVGEAPFCAIRFGSAPRYRSGARGTNHSLHGDALRQVAGLVDVRALRHRHMVSEELDRDRVD